MSLPSMGDGPWPHLPLLAEWLPGVCRIKSFPHCPSPLPWLCLYWVSWASEHCLWSSCPSEEPQDSILPKPYLVHSQELELPGCWGPALPFSFPAVRFDWDKSLLKVYSASSHQWNPVCSDSWNNSYSVKICQQLGFERYNFPKVLASGMSWALCKGVSGSLQEPCVKKILETRVEVTSSRHLELYKGTVTLGSYESGTGYFHEAKVILCRFKVDHNPVK